ncbi:MAG: hypothetical protein U0872_00590 [Planctomycetaceae bacterium]
MELPRAGQKLVFTKIGGDPKLSLSVRPKGALRFGASLAWVAATVIGAVLLFKALRRPEAQRHVTQLGACGLAVLGLVGWCLLPGTAAIVALGALAVGAMGVVWKAEVGRAKAEG